MELAAPLIQTVLPKIFGDEDDFSYEIQEQAEPQTETVSAKPEPITQQSTPNESITGAASGVVEQEFVPMTKNAAFQKFVAKNNPIANHYPEQEYYMISLNLWHTNVAEGYALFIDIFCADSSHFI